MGETRRHRVDTPSSTSWSTRGLNVVRGALIGTAETVPGVSGGTVALVVGVYDTAIGSASRLVTGARLALADLPRGRGFSRAAREFRQVPWGLIVPLLLGMFAALVLMAGLVEGWVEDQPVQSRALFFGLVLASLWVPFSLAARAPRADGATGPWRAGEVLLALLGAVAAFVIVSLPPGEVEATPPIIVAAAAIAVSALVLPGLSGSFLLLTFGLYETTLSAVNDRDFGYLGLFALGALLGLASFVKLMQWLLDHRQRVTLVVLTGVVAGCLRALWPWQDEDRALLAPDEHLGAAIGFGVLGFVVVAAFAVAEHRAKKRREAAAVRAVEGHTGGGRHRAGAPTP
ncbi:undecaprenyl phosphate translocase family protein [Streptomyces taklimakanensis]|uniref:undecaprenyl phosphate translocase family protein n=1 Tax=Streptomyces taklimakanensis TaxID=2569853 RepID=UPI00192E3900